MAHAEKARRMPPPMSGREVTEKQIDTVRRWIQEGAKWETHWAFNAPKRPEPPAVKNTAAVRNPIDNFIQARLEREESDARFRGGSTHAAAPSELRSYGSSAEP